MAGDPQQHRRAVPGQRQCPRAVTSKHGVTPGHPFGQCLRRVGEHVATNAVAQRLGVEFVGQSGEVGAHRRVDRRQRGQADGQVPAQAELLRHAQTRRQNRGAPGGGFPQRSLVGRGHHHPGAATCGGRGRGHQHRVARIVAGGHQHVQGADPGW